MRVFELTDLGVRVFYTPNVKPKEEHMPAHKDALLSNCSHAHTCYELHVVEEGCVLMYAAGTAYRVKEGELCLISPGTVHASAADASQVRRFCLSFELFSPAMPLAAHITHLPDCNGVHVADAKKLIPLVHQLQGEQYGRLLFSEALIRSLLSQIMIELVRCVSTSAAERAQTGSDLSDVRTFHIDDFFNNRFYCAEGEDTLAAELGISRRQLNRTVQRIYGKSFREKLQEVRLEAARELLLGGMHISEIAERLGYSSSSNFSVFFKRAAGITPSEYRRKFREKC